MKRLVTTCAVLGLVAAPALAAGGFQSDDTVNGDSSYSAQSEGLLPVNASEGKTDPSNTVRLENATVPVVNTTPAGAKLVAAQDLAGADLWVMNGSYDATAWNAPHPFDGTSANWIDVGKVTTLAVTADSSGAGIVARIGGFMNVEDKPVFVSLEDVRIFPAGNGGYGIVTRRTKADLAEQPESLLGAHS